MNAFSLTTFANLFYPVTLSGFCDKLSQKYLYTMNIREFSDFAAALLYRIERTLLLKAQYCYPGRAFGHLNHRNVLKQTRPTRRSMGIYESLRLNTA